MSKWKIFLVLTIAFLVLAFPNPTVHADKPEGKGSTKFNITAEVLYACAIENPAGYWGAPVLFSINFPDAPAFTISSVDIYKNGDIFRDDMHIVPQTAPNTYTVYIQEEGLPVEDSITYTIVVHVLRWSLSEDVTIYFHCQP